MLGNFGLTSDEWSFFAAIAVVALPLYVSSFRSRRAIKAVHHEVITNGGVGEPNPTLKDYAAGAYAEASAARVIADEARIASRNNGRLLDQHLTEAAASEAVILGRIDAVEQRSQQAIVDRDAREN